MKYLYYCNSAYQIIAAINLHWHRKHEGFENIPDYEGDLIILNSFSGTKDIYEKLSDAHVFNKVICIDKKYNKGTFHRIKTILDLLFPAMYLKEKYGLEKKDVKNCYDVIAVPKYAEVTDAIYRLNEGSAIEFIEDGMAAYIASTELYPYTEKSRKLHRALHCGGDFSNYRALYLDCPELYTGENVDKVKRIPRISNDCLEMTKNIFGASIRSDRDIYWIAQNLENDIYKSQVKDLLNILRKNKEHVLFRPHPRYREAQDYTGFEIDDESMSWEMKLMQMDNVDDILLISVHSTACFTPKMLFDKEPYIILFYRLVDYKVSFMNENYENTIKKFIKTYRDPEKIMIPENMDEFEECILKFINR